MGTPNTKPMARLSPTTHPHSTVALQLVVITQRNCKLGWKLPFSYWLLLLKRLRSSTIVNGWQIWYQGDVFNTKADELADRGKGSLEANGGRYSLDNPVTVFDVIAPPSAPTGSLNNKLQQFISALRQAEITSFPVNTATPRQPWLPPELARELEIAKRMQANLDPAYPAYYKEVKKRSRAAKRAWLTASLEANPDTTHPSTWKHLRKLRQGFSGRKRRLVVQGRQIPWSKTHEATRNHLHSSQWGPSEVTEEERQILRDSPRYTTGIRLTPGISPWKNCKRRFLNSGHVRLRDRTEFAPNCYSS